MDKPHLEVADIFRHYGEEYRNKHASTMSWQQLRVMRDIEVCRTAVLGGHVDECDTCGHQVISYNSCRNRHCPKCQALAKAKWLDARRIELLPVDYHHVIFTIPDVLLAPIALQNPRVFYDILFRAVSHTLLTIAADPSHLGARLGFIAVLHTWGQKLTHHPHVHCLVPGGGLAPNEQQWIACPSQFFLDVTVLSQFFKETMVKQLQLAFQKGLLKFHGSIQHLAAPEAFEQRMDSCLRIDWVVYSKPPFGGPETVLDYLARYTHSVAISNHRLHRLENGHVTFTYKDYKNDGIQGTLTLDAEEFIRRFLLHVLPDGFTRIRSYGFLANCHRKKKLKLCRDLLGVTEIPVPKSQHWSDLLISLTGHDPFECPKCHQGRLIQIDILPPLSHSENQLSRSPP